MSTRDELSQALLRAADGDRAALKFFYEATSAKLFGVINRILADRGDAEDVLQDVYVTIWRKAVEFDPSRASPITALASSTVPNASIRSACFTRREPSTSPVVPSSPVRV